MKEREIYTHQNLSQKIVESRDPETVCHSLQTPSPLVLYSRPLEMPPSCPDEWGLVNRGDDRYIAKCGWLSLCEGGGVCGHCVGSGGGGSVVCSCWRDQRRWGHWRQAVEVAVCVCTHTVTCT